MARVNATWERSHAECVLDALPQAVLVVDARQQHVPLLMSNAVARRCLGFHEEAGQMLGAPLHRYLGDQAAAGVDAALRAACNTAGPCVRVITWRMRRGELPLPTEFYRLRSDAGQCRVLITIITTSAAFERREAAGEAVSSEFESGDADRRRYFEIRAALVREAGIGSGVSIAMRDVTERRRLEREILEISSRERQSIGRDLHDGLGQELTGVALMLRALSTRIESACPALSGNVEEIVGVVNQSIEGVRSLARGLMPVSLDRDGLTPALRALAARSRTLYALDVLFHAQLSPELLMDEARASHLYRIAQEALTNAARHGRATAVEIFLHSTATHYLLRITDDGCGMSEAAHASKGMGLKIMAYRAGMIDASLEVVNNEPHGTIVRVTGQHLGAAHSGMMGCDI
jgi:signal transduction histidine kinase